MSGTRIPVAGPFHKELFQMSKINQIQQALLALDGGKFQKLADLLLVEKGYGRVNSIGSVVGADKVKPGTPDTLFVSPGGGFIFTEHTTQQSRLFEKILDDLGKCFDEGKTGVPTGKIERVIFCFTSRLDAGEENTLMDLCKAKGVGLDLFGIDAIASDLYRNYPGLAHDFLSIEIDTDQIVPPSRFVSLYNSSKLATRLDLAFHFREAELKGVLEALDANKLVFLSGRAGVGKTRLALEACHQFAAAGPTYELMCVYGRNRDLWDDLQIRFRRPGNFLILVDDANRVSSFDYIVDLLLHQREDQNIRVIATVRDYALAKVHEAALPLGSISDVELGPFTDEQIKGLTTDEYGITNYHYLERITQIARGNARLAVMAAEVALENALEGIHDVSELYDKYFASIKADLKREGVDLRNASLLKVAAIVSFFQSVDRTSSELMGMIEAAFAIPPDRFWEAANRLHNMELLDIYEDEVVRISDQVLGTYLFHLATFQEEVLNFGSLIEHFFPKWRNRITDSLNPVLSAFGTDRITSAIRPHIEGVWFKLEAAGDDIGLLELIEVFWFANRTQTLLWATKCISHLEPEILNISDISFEKAKNSGPSPHILNVLSSFAFVAEEETRIALDLLWRYVRKRPSEIPQVIRVLIDEYGFRPESNLWAYQVQHLVVDSLWVQVEKVEPYAQRIFLAVANSYLRTQFEKIQMKTKKVFTITRFDLMGTDELFTLRDKIWQRLFNLFRTWHMEAEIFEVISNYNSSQINISSKLVVERDAANLLPFLESALNPSDYHHDVLLHDFLDVMENHHIKVPEGMRDRYLGDIFKLADVLLPDRRERQSLAMSFEDFEKHKRDRWEEFISSFTFEAYVNFFEQCIEIHKTLAHGHEYYQLQEAVVSILGMLADRNTELYCRVLEHYLGIGDPFVVYGIPLVHKILERHSYERALDLIDKHQYPTKTRWLFHLYEALPAEGLSLKHLAHLWGLYEAAAPGDYPHGFDFLLKFFQLDPRLIPKVVTLVLQKAEKDPSILHALDLLFNPHTEVAKRISEVFRKDLDVLKRAYLAADSLRDHSDYKGKILDRLMTMDENFIVEFISWKYGKSEYGYLSDHDDHRDYSFIWRRPDYIRVMDSIVGCVVGLEKGHSSSITPYLWVFFRQRADAGDSIKEIQQAQDQYLLGLIDARSQDADFMRILFSVISQFSPERRRLFVERFVSRNQEFETFRNLAFEPSSWGWSGSKVPMLQARVDYWQSLLSLMKTVDLLQQKQYVESQLHYLLSEIEDEKKRDFIGD
jgi:hypothetical protein